MRYWKFLALPTLIAALLSIPSSVPAQVSINIGPEPVCPYGYYDFGPYNCTPYGSRDGSRGELDIYLWESRLSGERNRRVRGRARASFRIVPRNCFTPTDLLTAGALNSGVQWSHRTSQRVEDNRVSDRQFVGRSDNFAGVAND